VLEKIWYNPSLAAIYVVYVKTQDARTAN